MSFNCLLFVRWCAEGIYKFTVFFVYPLAWLYARSAPKTKSKKSVLHVSYMVHVPWRMTRILRKYGWHADYMAVGTSPHWSHCDYLRRRKNPILAAWYELWWFCRVVSHYSVVHFHFMVTMTRSGWEVPLLKLMGRRVIVHYRGCEARDREQNMMLHPELNICQSCDYNAEICKSKLNLRRRMLAERWADAVLVTTPDMLDFIPDAIVSSFFTPDESTLQRNKQVWDGNRPLRLLHVTNHPGIEGTERIREAVDVVCSKGFPIDFVHLHDVSQAEVIREMSLADVTIGKMKMGYYANSQIESMMCDVPVITWIRDEFIDEDIRNSGMILSHLDDLEGTLVELFKYPEIIHEKKVLSRSFVLKVHGEKAVLKKILACYQ